MAPSNPALCYFARLDDDLCYEIWELVVQQPQIIAVTVAADRQPGTNTYNHYHLRRTSLQNVAFQVNRESRTIALSLRMMEEYGDLRLNFYADLRIDTLWITSPPQMMMISAEHEIDTRIQPCPQNIDPITFWLSNTIRSEPEHQIPRLAIPYQLWNRWHRHADGFECLMGALTKNGVSELYLVVGGQDKCHLRGITFTEPKSAAISVDQPLYAFMNNSFVTNWKDVEHHQPLFAFNFKDAKVTWDDMAQQAEQHIRCVRRERKEKRDRLKELHSFQALHNTPSYSWWEAPRIKYVDATTAEDITKAKHVKVEAVAEVIVASPAVIGRACQECRRRRKRCIHRVSPLSANQSASISDEDENEIQAPTSLRFRAGFFNEE